MMEDFIRNGGSSERAVAAMEREGALNARAGGALSTRRDEQSSVKTTSQHGRFIPFRGMFRLRGPVL